ncbi:MAG TPA: hypothetical protein VMT35_00750 [Ignavibacteriaceae bacterium]|nr:hypothetical protein [Ignavibacteriaceae bacterium]
MGEIVFWTLLRIALLIPVLWILRGYIDFGFWWIISAAGIYAIIIHPTIVHYRLFEEQNKEVIESSLCSTCRNFDKTAVLCLKHDRHPTIDFIPCEGLHWEPIAKDKLDEENFFENED